LNEEFETPKISFPFFMAFNSLLNNMELVKKIYLTCAHGSERNGEISKGEFLQQAQQFSQITPLEVNILYSLINSFRKDGYVLNDD
jgi:solute carrier family 25 aspartate/glutamate transporter 12/13